MRKVFTSLDGFTSEKCEVLPYTEMSENAVAWIDKNTARLFNSISLFEISFKQKLERWNILFYQQVFFCIEENFFFLDFLLPEYNIAVEIDGKDHKRRKKRDNRRDELFRSIGVKTIRIKNEQIHGITHKYLIGRIKCVTAPKIKKKKNTGRSKDWSRQIKKAKREEKEYFRAKYGKNYKETLKLI